MRTPRRRPPLISGTPHVMDCMDCSGLKRLPPPHLLTRRGPGRGPAMSSWMVAGAASSGAPRQKCKEAEHGDVVYRESNWHPRCLERVVRQARDASLKLDEAHLQWQVGRQPKKSAVFISMMSPLKLRGTCRRCGFHGNGFCCA